MFGTMCCWRPISSVDRALVCLLLLQSPLLWLASDMIVKAYRDGVQKYEINLECDDVVN